MKKSPYTSYTIENTSGVNQDSTLYRDYSCVFVMDKSGVIIEQKSDTQSVKIPNRVEFKIDMQEVARINAERIEVMKFAAPNTYKHYYSDNS